MSTPSVVQSTDPQQDFAQPPLQGRYVEILVVFMKYAIFKCQYAKGIVTCLRVSLQIKTPKIKAFFACHCLNTIMLLLTCFLLRM